MEMSNNLREAHRLESKGSKSKYAKFFHKNLIKSKTYYSQCPFCSSSNTFDQIKMRCTECCTIVNQVKDYKSIKVKISHYK